MRGKLKFMCCTG